MKPFTRLVAIAIPFLLVTPIGSAQSASDTLLRELLSEVRALRITMQKSALMGLRGNLLVERIRTAQARATNTQEQIDNVRQQMSSIEQEQKRLATEVERMEERIRREYDAEIVDKLAQEKAQYEDYVGTLAQQHENLRRSESELLIRLDEDRVRLDGLEAQFDQLLREIEKALEEK